MHIRLADDADQDLDNIWWYVAAESASIDIANRLIDRISSRFALLASYPHLGPSRADVLGAGRRCLTAGEYVIVYAVENTEILVLRIVHGRRDLCALFDL